MPIAAIADVALFEVGQIFRGTRPDDQIIAATGVRRGTAGVNGAGRHWQGQAAPVSVYDAKADALALLDALGAPVDKFQIVAGCAVLVPSGPLRHDPARPAERHRLVRRVASRRRWRRSTSRARWPVSSSFSTQFRCRARGRPGRSRRWSWRAFQPVRAISPSSSTARSRRRASSRRRSRPTRR